MMDKDIVLSIIVPVYNVELYIERCLNSILPQVDDNVEVIIVNDCTPDSSIEKAERLTEGYNQVKIINRDANGGLSAARNTGISAASGRYCWFIDSDDYVAENAIPYVISELMKNSCELLLFNHIRVDNKDNILYESELGEFEIELSGPVNKNKFICDYIKNKYGYEVWRKIYSLDIIRRNNLLFEPNKKVFAEDICFNIMYILLCDKIHSRRNKFYYYLVREDSIMGRKTSKLSEMGYLCERLYPAVSDNTNIDYSSIYAGVLQIEYNQASWIDIDKYIKNSFNTKLAVKMNKQIIQRFKLKNNFYSKKDSIKHYLYANYFLSTLYGKRTKILWKKIIEVVKCIKG